MEILETGNIVIYLANAGVNAMTANADMVILFSASFLLVGLLGLQSKNVQGSKYLAAAMTSVAITVANFFFIRFRSWHCFTRDSNIITKKFFACLW